MTSEEPTNLPEPEDEDNVNVSLDDSKIMETYEKLMKKEQDEIKKEIRKTKEKEQ